MGLLVSSIFLQSFLSFQCVAVELGKTFDDVSGLLDVGFGIFGVLYTREQKLM